MAKGYWIVFYRSIRDPDALAAYAKLALPAIAAGGGRTLARGIPAATHEHGLSQRTVMLEFDSLGAAEATYQSPAYKEALAALGDAAERDVRIIAGVE